MQWPRAATDFFGWRVVGAAFVLATLGLGIGFFGPAIYLHAVYTTRGWSFALISAAVTTHFLAGAVVVANLPRLHGRFGLARVTKIGAVAMVVGVGGWAAASAPWQLFAAAMLSGAGWVALGIAAINAMVAPWFVRQRPAALAVAYTGANLGGVIFAPLWTTAIERLGFPAAAAAIGAATLVIVWLMADRFLAPTPQQMGLFPDGASAPTTVASLTFADASNDAQSSLWSDRRFLTLAAGMTIGLFAQLGLTAHLVSLLAPALGNQAAGLLVSVVAAMAIFGRMGTGWIITAGADRRLVAAASYAVQILGSLIFILAAGVTGPLLVLGALLFGLGFGNGTFLPPLIAQSEFAERHVARVVALSVALAQAGYAFAPVTFGLIREAAAAASPLLVTPTLTVFAAAGLLQGLAACLFLAGRNRHQRVARKRAAEGEGGER